jgi:hypothetical protein
MTVDGCKIRFASNGGRPRSSSQHPLQSPRCFCHPFRRYPFDRGTFVLSSGRRLRVAFSPCPPAADSKAAAPLHSKPSLRFSVPQGTVAAAATLPSRRSPSPSYPLSFPPTVCLLFCRCCCCFRWIFVFSCSLLPLICN